MSNKMSLAALVSWSTAGVIAVGMFLYAVFQAFMMRDMPIWRLVLEHGWHIIVLGLLTYACLHWILVRQVVRPINQLYVKIFNIGRGNLRPIEMDSGVREIAEIVDGVNFLVKQLGSNAKDPALRELQVEAQILRTLAAKTNDRLESADRQILMQVAEKLEKQIVSFVHRRFGAEI